MRPGDFVLINDVLGCVQTLTPLTVLCQDGEVRSFTATPTTIITGQQYALLLAEEAMRRIRDGH